MLLRTLIALLFVCLLVTSGNCIAPQDGAPLERQAPDMPVLALPAVAAAVHASAVLLDDPAHISVLDEAGCYVWQQPGAALVVTDIWIDGDAPQIWFAEEKVMQLFEHLPELTVGEPVVYPREPDYVDEFFMEPRVYVLDAEASRRRLATYLSGLETWAGYNEGAGFIIPEEAGMATDIGIVYIDSGGPLEFHFQVGESGRLVLRHFVTFDFFSA
jgi:hypothetical protein